MSEARALKTAVNHLLHQAMGVETCATACTHFVTDSWSALAVANSVMRVQEGLDQKYGAARKSVKTVQI